MYLSIIVFFIFYKFFINTNAYVLVKYINYINKPFCKKQIYYDTNIGWCDNLKNNWIEIKNEYINYINNYKLIKMRDIDYAQSLVDLSEINWFVIYLKCFNKYTNNIKHFPNTYKLISKIPGCTLAMFSILEPGKKIPTHNGPYNGVLRYHLALITDKTNNENCFIVVNNIKYFWKEGEDVMFDDYYEHYVENNTQTTRVILFLDIEKKFNNLFIKYLNKIFLFFIKNNETVNNVINKANNIKLI